MNTALKLSQVSYARAGRTVLNSIDLELQFDERLAVLGPSGGGKTTLLRLISGLETPDSGSIDVNGRRASDATGVLIPPEHREVSFVFQDLALWSHMTVTEHLDFALLSQHLAKAERRARIDTMLDAVNLGAHARRRPGSLSGGERQRVAIARALITEPRLVLFDEPLANLDILLKQQLLELFCKLLSERRIAALYITHDPLEAQTLTDRLAILDGAKLSSFSPSTPTRADSLSPFATALQQNLAAFRRK
jgi:iron(III) transport system ATP-binding protein